jgi:hypothetical protein
VDQPPPTWSGKGALGAAFDANNAALLKTAAGWHRLQGNEPVPEPPVVPEAHELQLSPDRCQVLLPAAAEKPSKPVGPIHALPVRLMALSGDERYLVTITEDNRLHLLEVRTGLPIGPVLQAPAGVAHVLWSATGHQILLWGPETALLWDW